MIMKVNERELNCFLLFDIVKAVTIWFKKEPIEANSVTILSSIIEMIRNLLSKEKI